MKTPAFWYTEKTDWRAHLLAAPSALYALGHALNMKMARPRHANIPVICIGNITAGGAGKTPVARAIMRLIMEHDIAANPVFLTRGYGGSEYGPIQINPATHTADQVGDEALLLTHDGPVIVSANRFTGAEYAAANRFDMVIMDDGFHNTSLHPDLNIMVVDGHHGFGNGLMIPAGPLRAPIHDGFARAHAVVIIGDDRTNIAARVPRNKTMIRMYLCADAQPQHDLIYHGFCGLGLPEKFKNTLIESEYNLVDFTAFADHHPYTQNDLNTLSKMAREKNARLITTEKDAMRIPDDFIQTNQVEILPVSMRINDADAAHIADMIRGIKK